jgi:fluoroquinolone transport system permease protein
MKTSTHIVKTDLRNILRDPSLVILLFIPFLITALLRWGYPWFLEMVPEAAGYNMLLLGMLSMTCGAMPGMAIAFAILDEKDNGLLPVLMILPVPFRNIVLSRMLAICLYGTAAAFIAIAFSGLSDATNLQNLLLSFLAASPSVIMGLIPAFFAGNKIEGATIAKVLNFFLIFPLPAFIFAGWWTRLLAVLPAWWVYRAFTGTDVDWIFLTALGTGLLFHFIIAALLVKRIFNKILKNV